jgi:hypothetical protein
VQRRLVLVVVWGLTTLAVTLWIRARGEEVTTDNAMMVGVVAGTAVTAALARTKRE